MVVSPMLAEAPPRAVFLSDLHLGWQLAQQTTWRGWEIQSSATHITQLGVKYRTVTSSTASKACAALMFCGALAGGCIQSYLHLVHAWNRRGSYLRET